MKPQRAAAAELVVHEVVLKPNESLHLLLSCSCFSGSGLQRQVIIICVFAPSIFPIARTRRPSESSSVFRRESSSDRRAAPVTARPRAQIQKTVSWKRRAFKNFLQKKRFVHAAQQTRSKYTCRDTRMRLNAGNTVVQGRFAPRLAFSVLAPATKVSRSYLPLLPRRALRDHVRGVQRVSLKHEGRYPHCAPSVICRRQEHRRSSS